MQTNYMRLLAIFSAVACMAFAAPVLAQTVGVPSGGGGVVAQGIDDSVPLAGTTVRAVNAQLSQFSFSLRSTTPSMTVRPHIYPVVGGAIGANPVWTGADVTVSSTAFTDYTFSPAFTVTPGSDYALIVEKTVANQTGEIEWVFADDYADGVPVFYNAGISSWTDNPSLDAVFSATFAPPPTPVPTMTEWAMLFLGLTLAGGTAVLLQRRRIAA